MNEQVSQTVPAFLQKMTTPRRPRIALMGEFSAGKSTLANLIIGTDPLPMQVVATQLPPVWVSHGSGKPVIVDLEGNEQPCDLDSINSVRPSNVAYIRFQCEEKILECCDIIDMPGISDPNMSSEVWERVMPAADGVVWCSPATQAWRQSEAAVWETMEPALQENSMLLLTRADMLQTEKDQSKVLRRVCAEANGLFAHIQLISLLEARQAIDHEELWVSSGAEEFVNGYLSLVDKIGQKIDADYRPIGRHEERENLAITGVSTTSSPDQIEEAHQERVTPRRPVAQGVRRSKPGLDPQTPETFTPKFS